MFETILYKFIEEGHIQNFIFLVLKVIQLFQFIDFFLRYSIIKLSLKNA